MRTLLRTALVLLGQLPLPLLHGLGWLLGLALWLLPNKLRRVSLRNLELCFPKATPDWRSDIARRSLIESAKAVLEAPAIWFGSAARLHRWTGDEATRARLQESLAAGRGAILLTPHLGSWELAGQFCAALADITLLYKPQKGASDEVIRAGRSRNPRAHLVPTTAGGVKALLAALKRGEMIGLLPDHDPPESSGTRFAPLFGVAANTMDLVAKLAARTGAPVWFIVAERRACGRGFRFHLNAAPTEIDNPETGPTTLNQGLEACITARPEQYWWSYKRFRRRPAGAPDLYQRNDLPTNS